MEEDELVEKWINRAISVRSSEIRHDDLRSNPNGNGRQPAEYKEIVDGVDLLANKGLLVPKDNHNGHGVFYERTSFFNDVVIAGGWAAFQASRIEKANEERESEKLKRQNLLLSNEKMEYEQTIRKLQQELTTLSIVKNWWWLLASAFALGGVIGKFLFN